MNLKLLVCLLPSLLASCAYQNAFETFYTPNKNLPIFNQATEQVLNPEIVFCDRHSFDSNYYELLSRGFVKLGSSEFTYTYGYSDCSGSFAQEYAKRIGASIILLTDFFDSQETSVVPLSSPIFLPNGKVIDNTTYVPQTLQRNYCLAYFFKKFPLDKFDLGIYFKPIAQEKKAEIGSNYGLELFAIVENSVAEKKGFLPGDILLEANGIPLRQNQDLLSILKDKQIKKIKFKIRTNGKIVFRTIDR